jgi:putative nucleotidyltransferase with HDIG domain
MATSLLAPPQPVAQRIPLASIRKNVLDELERIETYPTLSDATIRAMAMVHAVDTSTAEVAALIRRDTVLAAAVLRLANNWTYRGKKEVDDVQQAVLRIGLSECSRLLCTIGMRGMTSSHPPAVQKRCEALLRHSLFVAHLASAANRTAKLGFTGVEFTAGLLHDVGRVVASVKAPLDAPFADPIDYEEEEEIPLQREREHLGIDHCAIGYHFAQKNNLPEGLVRVLLNHHRPHQETFQKPLVMLIAMMDRIANYAQREHKITDYDLAKCPIYPLLADLWTREQRVEFRRSFSVIIVQSIRQTRKMLKAIS